MEFSLDQYEQNKLNQWLKEIYAKVIEEQKAQYGEDNPVYQMAWDCGAPYDGAIGGGLTYEFSPTSIGMVKRVTYRGYALDLTDYESW